MKGEQRHKLKYTMLTPKSADVLCLTESDILAKCESVIKVRGRLQELSPVCNNKMEKWKMLGNRKSIFVRSLFY